jgi:hypothetical protein
MPRVLATFDAGLNPSFVCEPVPANPSNNPVIYQKGVLINQFCGSGPAWIRIYFIRLDLDPDPHSEFLRIWVRVHMGKNDPQKEKSEEMYCFEVLDVLF